MNGERSSGPVYCCQTYFLDQSKNGAEHFEIHVRPEFQPVTIETALACRVSRCKCQIYLTHSQDVFYEAIGYEGTERRCVIAWQPGKRANGSACKVATAITRAESTVAA